MGAIGFGPRIGVGLARPATAFDFSLGALPPGATFARSSGATWFDAAGRLISVDSDVPRFPQATRGDSAFSILIEPAASNLCAFSDGPLSKYSSKDVVDDPGKIAGFANAIGFPASVIGSYDFATRSIAAIAGSIYTISVIVAMVDGGAPVVDLLHAVGDFTPVLYNGYGETLDVRALGAGLYRIAASRTAPAAASTTQGIFKYSGQSQRAFRITGLQFEVGAKATSYIPTGSAPAARAADRLMLDWRSRGVADGMIELRYVFDDHSSEIRAAQVQGGTSAVPTDLVRPYLRRVERA